MIFCIADVNDKWIISEKNYLKIDYQIVFFTIDCLSSWTKDLNAYNSYGAW
jgi:hypothetical protein